MNTIEKDISVENEKDSNETKSFSLKTILFATAVSVSVLLIVFAYLTIRNRSNDDFECQTSVVFDADFSDYLIYFEIKEELSKDKDSTIVKYRDLVKLNLKTNEKESITEGVYKKDTLSNPKVSPDGKAIFFIQSGKESILISHRDKTIKSMKLKNPIKNNDSFCIAHDNRLFWVTNPSSSQTSSNVVECKFPIDRNEKIILYHEGKFNNLILDHEDNLIFYEESKNGFGQIWRLNPSNSEDQNHRKLQDYRQIIYNFGSSNISNLKLSLKNKLLFVSTSQKHCLLFILSKNPIVSKKLSIKGYAKITNIEFSKNEKYLYVVAQKTTNSTKYSFLIVDNFNFKSIENDSDSDSDSEIEIVGWKIPNLELEVDEIAIM